MVSEAGIGVRRRVQSPRDMMAVAASSARECQATVGQPSMMALFWVWRERREETRGGQDRTGLAGDGEDVRSYERVITDMSWLSPSLHHTLCLTKHASSPPGPLPH